MVQFFKELHFNFHFTIPGIQYGENMKSPILKLYLIIFCIVSSAYGSESLTLAEVQSAQKEWAEAIISIGEAHANNSDYKSLTKKLVNKLYAYELGVVLFAPTKAAQVPFRPTLDEAISYFIGGSIAEDTGFALTPWKAIRFDNVRTILGSDYAVSMGHYYFTDANTATETMVEFTFAYIKDNEGKLRIIAHHSSLPYAPKK